MARASDDTPQEVSAQRSERASLREVAKTAGVSLSSASRALSGHPEVSPKLRERVNAAAAQLGYEPNLLWQSLRGGSTHTVGMVVREIASPLLAEIALGSELALQARGYSMLISNARGDATQDVAHMRLLDQRRVDGLLVQPTDPSDPATLETLSRLRVPFVGVDRDIQPDLGGGAVLIDHTGGIERAVSYLADLGHKRIALVSPPRSLRPGRLMIEGLERIAAERDLVPIIAEAPFIRDRVRGAAERVLDEKPTALISGSGHHAPGVLLSLRKRGLRVRDDISLIAFDDLSLMPCMDPPITVISKSPRRVGEMAADLLADMIQGKSRETLEAPTELIMRESCGPPPH